MSKRFLAFTVGLAITSLMFFSAQFALAINSGYLVLTVDCIKQNGDGSYTAQMGYQNSNRYDGYTYIGATIGEDNMFSPGEPNRGQPASFRYGQFPGAFSVTWDGTPLNWKVKYRVGGQQYESSIDINSQDPEQLECKLVPYADCIVRDYGQRENGSWYEHYITYYSYFNPGSSTEIPFGPNNIVGHSLYCDGETCYPDLPQNQPTTFQPGHIRAAFTISSLREGEYGNTSDTYWKLTVGEDTYYASSTWNYTRECDVRPIRECLQAGCAVAGQKGTKTAWFGYKNLEPFVVRIPKQNYYNSLRESYGCDYNRYNGYDNYGRPCIYPQPEEFQPGTTQKAFGVCFSGFYNNDEGGSGGEDIPLEEAGLNNVGYAQWRLGSGWYDNGNYHYAMISSDSKMCNRAPVCDAGTYQAPCTAGVASVYLNPALSKDPDGDDLSYQWTNSCTGAQLIGQGLAQAVLMSTNPETCSIQLTVTEQTPSALTTTCEGSVTFQACTGEFGEQCANRDMGPSRYMLATIAEEQRKLIERGVVYLRRSHVVDKTLTRYLRLAEQHSAANKKLASSYPATVNTCATSVQCGARNMSNIGSGYRKTASKLDQLSVQLSRKLRLAKAKAYALRCEKMRKELGANLGKLMDSMPRTGC